MSLPIDIRRRLGISKGGSVYVEETEHGVVLRTHSQIIAHAQAMAKKYAHADGASVDDFIGKRSIETGA
jgi:bifunctional DNA-binding transcriptional regulator/antitoxin component of YhaV-PrlF toxin-antitoxin module